MHKLSLAFAGVAVVSLLASAPPAVAKRHSNTIITRSTASANSGTSTASTEATTSATTSTTSTNRGRNRNTNKGTDAPPAIFSPTVNQANGSTVAIVSGGCDSLTDGDDLGCMFSGNINTSTSGNSSYLLAQDAYNDAFDPDIALTPLAEFDGSGSSNGISLTLNDALNGGTFSFGSGVDLLYYAVKSGNNFILYQYTGTNSFTTDGLQMGENTDAPALSHIIFFGDLSGGVPEPATWAMMLIGMGMVGSSIRRRRDDRTALRQFA